jgi:hypothetical protein
MRHPAKCLQLGLAIGVAACGLLFSGLAAPAQAEDETHLFGDEIFKATVERFSRIEVSDQTTGGCLPDVDPIKLATEDTLIDRGFEFEDRVIWPQVNVMVLGYKVHGVDLCAAYLQISVDGFAFTHAPFGGGSKAVIRNTIAEQGTILTGPMDSFPRQMRDLASQLTDDLAQELVSFRDEVFSDHPDVRYRYREIEQRF